MLGRNTYLIPPVSSRPSAADLDGVEILLHHHHHHHHQQYLHHQPDAFSGLYLAANAPASAEEAAAFESGEASVAAPVRKQAAKKDRHSKIHTAQGPRDRRVRLSIDIARKFFDLQEMLGFDKPSKTLDWLLTKSKAAIKELVQTSARSRRSSPSACDMISSDQNGDDHSSRYKSGGKDKEAAASSLAKESRAKARARARERTLEKMCIKQLGGGDRCDGSGSSSSSLKSGGFRDPVSHLPLRSEAAAATQDLIEESIVIKRKNKNNPSVLGFQQNLVFSRDLNSTYMIPSANSNENWDVFGLTSQSNLHAAFDQHKFFHSYNNSNI